MHRCSYHMKCLRRAAALASAFGLLGLLSQTSLAQTPLPAFNGAWTGSGTDRNAPFQTFQQTQCRTRVTADAIHFAADTLCNGAAGLRKRWQLSVTFNGSNFTGTVVQTSRTEGDSPSVLNGTVTGEREGDVANFIARFPGLTPNAHVALALSSANSFSMTVRALGATLTDIKFQR
jgi:hypothetical protein